MKKDLNWFKEQLDDIEMNTPRLSSHDSIWMLDRVNELLNQLDESEVEQLDRKIEELESYNDELIRDNNQLRNELDNQEVLSQEWIDEHEEQEEMYGAYGVPVHKLQNLLVPKQELPVIPKFVAEWYESEGKRNSWWNWFYKWGRDESRTELETKTIRWMQYFNEETFVDMFLHGYEVEEEQKYYVLDKDNIIMIGKVNNGKVLKRNFDTPFNNFNEPAKEKAQLTEQEIKDYDERYWPFAVKVEELE